MDTMNDQAATPAAPSTPSDPKEMTMSASEYPALEGLVAGATGRITHDFTVSDVNGDQLTLSLSNCDIESEGPADREFRTMRSQDGEPEKIPSLTGDDF